MNPRLESINRIILSVGHGGLEGEKYDPGAINLITKEKENIIAKSITDKLTSYLTKNGLAVLLLPDFGLSRTINYVNSIGDKDTDWAIEIHKDSALAYNPVTMNMRIGIYYHPISGGSKDIAEEMVSYMMKNGSDHTSWSRPDTDSRHKRLGWIREPKMLSHIIEAGFIQDDNSKNSNDLYARLIAGAICNSLEKQFIP